MTPTTVYEQPFTVRLKHTDAAGVLYFSQQLDLAHEAYESWMDALGYPLSQFLAEKSLALPIRHCEAEFFAPLSLGDQGKIHVQLVHIGQSSFKLSYEFLREIPGTKELHLCGKASTLHVAVDPKTGRKSPLPKKLEEEIASNSGIKRQ